VEKKVIIGLSIVVALAAIIGIHSWLHKLLKFKMDESAILRFLNVEADAEFHSAKSISLGTDIPEERVMIVCSKSYGVSRSPNESELWRLK
jgi:hypothetical protein